MSDESKTAKEEFYQSLPGKRLAAGILFFNEAGDLLIVRASGKTHWNIPGGIIEADESPRRGCIREVREGIGLDCTPGRLLCVDYMESDGARTESLKFIFHGGTLNAGQIAETHFADEEICNFKFVKPDEAPGLLNYTLGARVAQCLPIIDSEQTPYLENQKVVLN